MRSFAGIPIASGLAGAKMSSTQASPRSLETVAARPRQTTEQGALFAMGGPAAGLARSLAWLWRLGPVHDMPAENAVGIGGLAEAGELEALVRSGLLAGAVVLAAEPGGPVSGLPGRRRVHGVACFAGGLCVRGDFTIFAAEHGPVESSLGCHAVQKDGVLTLGMDASCQGNLAWFWGAAAVADFLVKTLERPLVQLPPIGCLRLDDIPGTAQHQVSGRAKSDRRQRRRVKRLIRTLERTDSKMVVAVAARALDGAGPTPLDMVWPRSVAELARGVAAGALEPACHGTLHLDTAAFKEGHIEPREFARLDSAEAGRRIDEATAWLSERLGPAASFVAPAWGYSPGTLDAAAQRQLPSWLPPAPAPLLEDPHFHETLETGLPGLHRLDYRPLRFLAEIGLPPTVVFHGGLLDDRMENLSLPRDLVSLARLAVRRDLFRIPRVGGVRWVGAGELIATLRAHDRIRVVGDRVELPPGSEAVVRDRNGSRRAVSEA